MNPKDIESRYMNGHCHALAYVLSEVLQLPVGVLYATRSKEGRIADPLHVYVRLKDKTIIDVKGVRSIEEMESDFKCLVQLIRKHENDVVAMEHEILADANDLYDSLGFDPSSIERAIADLIEYIWDSLALESKPLLDASDIHRRTQIPTGCQESEGFFL